MSRNRETIEHYVSVLREVQQEFHVHTNIDTAIRTYESILKEMEK